MWWSLEQTWTQTQPRINVRPATSRIFFSSFLSFAKFVLVPSNETSSMTHHNCVSPVFRRFDSVFNFQERLGQKRPRRWCSKRSGGSGVNKHIRFTETDDDGAEPRCSAALQKVAICLAAYLYTSLSKCQLFMCAQDHCWRMGIGLRMHILPWRDPSCISNQSWPLQLDWRL